MSSRLILFSSNSPGCCTFSSLAPLSLRSSVHWFWSWLQHPELSPSPPARDSPVQLTWWTSSMLHHPQNCSGSCQITTIGLSHSCSQPANQPVILGFPWPWKEPTYWQGTGGHYPMKPLLPCSLFQVCSALWLCPWPPRRHLLRLTLISICHWNQSHKTVHRWVIGCLEHLLHFFSGLSSFSMRRGKTKHSAPA